MPSKRRQGEDPWISQPKTVTIQLREWWSQRQRGTCWISYCPSWHSHKISWYQPWIRATSPPPTCQNYQSIQRWTYLCCATQCIPQWPLPQDCRSVYRRWQSWHIWLPCRWPRPISWATHPAHSPCPSSNDDGWQHQRPHWWQKSSWNWRCSPWIHHRWWSPLFNTKPTHSPHHEGQFQQQIIFQWDLQGRHHAYHGRHWPRQGPPIPYQPRYLHARSECGNASLFRPWHCWCNLCPILQFQSQAQEIWSKFAAYLATMYGNGLVIHRGLVHDYIGMELNFSQPGIAQISMVITWRKSLMTSPQKSALHAPHQLPTIFSKS
jgi:hypothetical protein